jgi:hypothetical protein
MAQTPEEKVAANRAKVRRYRERNLEKVRERVRKWQANLTDKDKERIDKQRRERRAANLDVERAKVRQRYATNPEKYQELSRMNYAANPEKAAEINRKWREAHPEKVRAMGRAHCAARYARKLHATPPWVNSKDLLAIYEGCPEGYHVDHIHPLKGKLSSGLNVPWNINYLPDAENQRKHSKAPPPGYFDWFSDPLCIHAEPKGRVWTPTNPEDE